MWLTVVIVVLVLVLIASLVVSHLAYRKEQELAAIENAFSAQRSRSEHIDDIQMGVQHLNLPTLAWNYLIDFHIHLLNEMKSIKPNAPGIDDTIQEQENLRGQQGSYQIPNTDRGIVKAQKYIKFTLRAMRQMRGENLLTPHQLEEINTKLSYCHNIIEIDAHTHQGIHALNKRHYQEGTTHLKHARALLIRTLMDDAEREVRLHKLDKYLENPYETHPPEDSGEQ
ncbi:hypothetical protein ACKC9G_02445 [Pokkaliibacter sp. CJK22405]|uniref:hypothetical protein n=1 Tax=Pokkaliibacter sp. CJK22405 TaxID=3384615 RepID=UPI003984DED0